MTVYCDRHRSVCEKTKSRRDDTTSSDPYEHYLTVGIWSTEDAVTSDSNYQSLRQHHAAIYTELTPATEV